MSPVQWWAYIFNMPHPSHTSPPPQPTANKTRVLNHVLLLVLLGTQVSKGVDDDTKNQVLNNDDCDEKEKGEVVDSTSIEQSLLWEKMNTG